jgi:hypothetical protein
MSKEFWEQTYDEHLANDSALRLMVRRGGESVGQPDRVLFERDDQGLTVSYYFTAQNAVMGQYPVATICYGWDTVLCEKDDKRLAFLDKVSEHIGMDYPLGCEHDGFTCEQMFHAGQVILGNDEPDGCEVCLDTQK